MKRLEVLDFDLRKYYIFELSGLYRKLKSTFGFTSKKRHITCITNFNIERSQNIIFGKLILNMKLCFIYKC